MAEVDLPQQFVGRFCNVGLSVPSRSHSYSNHPAAVHVEEVTKWIDVPSPLAGANQMAAGDELPGVLERKRFNRTLLGCSTAASVAGDSGYLEPKATAALHSSFMFVEVPAF